MAPTTGRGRDDDDTLIPTLAAFTETPHGSALQAADSLRYRKVPANTSYYQYKNRFPPNTKYMGKSGPGIGYRDWTYAAEAWLSSIEEAAGDQPVNRRQLGRDLAQHVGGAAAELLRAAKIERNGQLVSVAKHGTVDDILGVLRREYGKNSRAERDAFQKGVWYPRKFGTGNETQHDIAAYAENITVKGAEVGEHLGSGNDEPFCQALLNTVAYDIGPTIMQQVGSTDYAKMREALERIMQARDRERERGTSTTLVTQQRRQGTPQQH
jgi:hypothetical protein